MIIWHSVLFALTLFCTVVNIRGDNFNLGLLCALCAGLNLGMVIYYAVGK